MQCLLSPRRFRSFLSALFCLLPVQAFAGQQSVTAVQTSDLPGDNPVPAPDEPALIMFPHAEWDRLWLSGQANFISQWHPAFHSPYQGKNSLTPEVQDASSRVLTPYTGSRVPRTTEFLCDVPHTGGHGLGEALGIAG